MPFREGVEPHEVSNFRAVVKHAKELDERVDVGQLTPSEALADLLHAIEKADLTVKPPPPEEIPQPEKPKRGFRR